MTEQQLQTKIINFLFEQKIFAFKVIQATTSGQCDITACLNGVFVGIEVKKDNTHPTPLQEYTHKRILKSGGVVFVVKPKTFDNFKEKILELKNSIGIIVKKDVKQNSQSVKYKGGF